MNFKNDKKVWAVFLALQLVLLPAPDFVWADEPLDLESPLGKVQPGEKTLEKAANEIPEEVVEEEATTMKFLENSSPLSESDLSQYRDTLNEIERESFESWKNSLPGNVQIFLVPLDANGEPDREALDALDLKPGGFKFWTPESGSEGVVIVEETAAVEETDEVEAKEEAGQADDVVADQVLEAADEAEEVEKVDDEVEKDIEEVKDKILEEKTDESADEVKESDEQEIEEDAEETRSVDVKTIEDWKESVKDAHLDEINFTDPVAADPEEYVIGKGIIVDQLLVDMDGENGRWIFASINEEPIDGQEAEKVVDEKVEEKELEEVKEEADHPTEEETAVKMDNKGATISMKMEFVADEPEAEEAADEIASEAEGVVAEAEETADGVEEAAEEAGEAAADEIIADEVVEEAIAQNQVNIPPGSIQPSVASERRNAVPIITNTTPETTPPVSNEPPAQVLAPGPIGVILGAVLGFFEGENGKGKKGRAEILKDLFEQTNNQANELGGEGDEPPITPPTVTITPPPSPMPPVVVTPPAHTDTDIPVPPSTTKYRVFSQRIGTVIVFRISELDANGDLIENNYRDIYPSLYNLEEELKRLNLPKETENEIRRIYKEHQDENNRNREKEEKRRREEAEEAEEIAQKNLEKLKQELCELYPESCPSGSKPPVEVAADEVKAAAGNRAEEVVEENVAVKMDNKGATISMKMEFVADEPEAEEAADEIASEAEGVVAEAEETADGVEEAAEEAGEAADEIVTDEVVEEAADEVEEVADAVAGEAVDKLEPEEAEEAQAKETFEEQVERVQKVGALAVMSDNNPEDKLANTGSLSTSVDNSDEQQSMRRRKVKRRTTLIRWY